MTSCARPTPCSRKTRASAAYSLRQAAAAEAAPLAALHEALFPAGPWDERFFAGAIASPYHHLLVARHAPDETLAGLALWTVIAEDAEILTIGVSPRLRRQGLGAALLDAVIKRSATLGATRLLLDVAAGNDAALALYRQAGFTPLTRRKRYYDNGEDALVLSRALAASDASPVD